MGARQSGQALREARVLSAARELFSEKGYDATSVRDIAERAGVSVGTVARTGDKSTLLASMFDENETIALRGRIAALGPLVPGRSFADEMAEVFDEWFAAVADDTDLVRDYMVALLVGPQPRGSLDDDVVDALARRLMRHHLDLDPAVATDLAFATYATWCTLVVAVLLGVHDHPTARDRAVRTIDSITGTL